MGCTFGQLWLREVRGGKTTSKRSLVGPTGLQARGPGSPELSHLASTWLFFFLTAASLPSWVSPLSVSDLGQQDYSREERSMLSTFFYVGHFLSSPFKPKFLKKNIFLQHLFAELFSFGVVVMFLSVFTHLHYRVNRHIRYSD